MPSRKQRSRSFRKVFRKTSGKVAVHYKRKKPKAAKCGSCGAVLKGVPRELPHKMRNLPKSKKRPSRPYGGFLCSRCMRQKIIKEARK